VRRGVELYHTYESRRSALRALRLFFVFAAENGYPHNRMVAWHRIARTIGGAARAEPLLSSAEIRAAATALGRIEPEGVALAVAEPFRSEVGRQKLDPRKSSAGLGKALDEPEGHWVRPSAEDDWDGVAWLVGRW